MVSSVFALCLIILLVGISAIVFPYRRKEMLKESMLAQNKIAGPLLMLTGILTVAVTMLCSYYYLTVDELAANSNESLLMIAVIFISGLVLYIAARNYRRRQGIDVDLAFREIAPE